MTLFFRTISSQPQINLVVIGLILRHNLFLYLQLPFVQILIKHVTYCDIRLFFQNGEIQCKLPPGKYVWTCFVEHKR